MKYFFCFLLVSNFAIGQEYILKDTKNSIPISDNNRKFISEMNEQFSKLIVNGADSVLFYYKLNFQSNYGVIYWKKNARTQIMAFYQYDPSVKNVGREILKNSILHSVNIKKYFYILKDNKVRELDTSGFTSEEYPIYCKFYFAKRQQAFAGYAGKVNLTIETDFINAYAAEQSRIVKRELNKSMNK